MRKIYVIPTKYAYKEYPEHFTKGKRYKVVDEHYRTDRGTTLQHSVGEENTLTIEMYLSNEVGGKLL